MLFTLAVKVTEVPGQIVVCVAVMLSVGVTDGFTVIVIVLDVAVGVEAHERLEVMMLFITSPFRIAAGVNVERTDD
jgi:hypothetical protein